MKHLGVGVGCGHMTIKNPRTEAFIAEQKIAFVLLSFLEK